MTVLLSDATTIQAGQSITFQVTGYLVLPSNVDCTLCEAQVFAGGGAAFRSGDGQQVITTSFSQDLSVIGPVTFQYLVPGNYTASSSGTIFQHTAKCGLGMCGTAYPNSTPYLNFTVTENITVLPGHAPEPATWALFLLGILAITLMKGRMRAWTSFGEWPRERRW